VATLARQVSEHAHSNGSTSPVVFFNASTRLGRLSLNAAFSLISSWAVQLQGVPVVHYVCRSGLTPCVLGTHRDDPHTTPPCGECITFSRGLYGRTEVRWFEPVQNSGLERDLAGLPLHALMSFCKDDLPLGELVLPSLRWILRRHHLQEDENTHYLYRQYMLSAWNLARQFSSLLDELKPKAVVMFNGMFYPEAIARWVSHQHGINAISHEVAIQPFSAFFTEGEATAYPIDIPQDFELTPDQNTRLDAYLEQRFQGNFSMAGIRFWPEMRTLGEDFWQRVGNYRQVVPVFTNVVFDTSQGHANRVFPHMFAWLDLVLELIRAHPETFFVIRAHPDESRPGKESRESVRDWVTRNQVDSLPNVLFVDSHAFFSSYEIVTRSKFVMIYNSTIGLEAAILGAVVLSGGKARFTQLPTVFFPSTVEAFRQQAEQFLHADRVEAPPEFQRNARRFLYYQLFRTSLPFGDWLDADPVWPGFVTIKPFDWQTLLPENNPTVQVILDGVLHGGDFLRED
jgi:hypothetical protein